MTHEDLRKRAVKWLTGTRRCSVVISEMVSAAWETPDAIGWHSGRSILVECKVSRADFHRNGDKGTLAGDRGVGTFRYFMVPEDLIFPEDMNKYPGYGLLSVNPAGRVWTVKESVARDSNQTSEIAMLISALRRIKTREFLTIVAEGNDPQ